MDDRTNPDHWRADFDATTPDTIPDDATLDLATITGYARRHARRLAELDALDRTAADLHAEIDEWRNRRAKPIDEAIAHHRGVLEHYAAQRHADDPKAKTIELPDGTKLERRVGRLSATIVDEAAAIGWAKTNRPALVITTDKLSKSAITAEFGAKASADAEDVGAHPAITADGEIVPGIIIERGAPTITVKPPKKLDRVDFPASWGDDDE